MRARDLTYEESQKEEALRERLWQAADEHPEWGPKQFALRLGLSVQKASAWLATRRWYLDQVERNVRERERAHETIPLPERRALERVAREQEWTPEMLQQAMYMMQHFWVSAATKNALLYGRGQPYLITERGEWLEGAPRGLFYAYGGMRSPQDAPGWEASQRSSFNEAQMHVWADMRVMEGLGAKAVAAMVREDDEIAARLGHAGGSAWLQTHRRRLQEHLAFTEEVLRRIQLRPAEAQAEGDQES